MIYLKGQRSTFTQIMLHNKFEGNRPSGSGEEEFKRDFTLFEHGGHFGHVS